MKFSINEKPAAEHVPEYPCLMKSKTDALVVFFTEYGNGVVVRTDGFNTVGKYSEGWYMSALMPFHGTVTLEN